MPAKVIPFPGANGGEKILQSLTMQQDFVLKVGSLEYAVEMRGQIRLLPRRTGQSGESVVCVASRREKSPPAARGEREHCGDAAGWRDSDPWANRARVHRQWAEHRRKLRIARCSPKKRRGRKQLLAFPRKESDESTCAGSAQKEKEMSNGDESNKAAEAAGATAGAEGQAKKTKKPKAVAGKRGKGGSAAKGQTKRKTTGGKRAGGKAAEVKAKGPHTASKGAQILEMIRRSKGASLGEIQKVTGWQAHSVRGFLSTAAKKHGVKIESRRSEAGERVYQAR